uniref:PAP-associated domain-containing protein n=1 Tax=Panagrellus redivivus TaxID=6233 RepID=A0A7E4VPM2_PANRE
MGRSKSVPKKIQINELESMVSDIAKTNLEQFPEVEIFVNRTLSEYNTLKLNQSPGKSARSNASKRNTPTNRSISLEAALPTKRFRLVDDTLHDPPPGSITWAGDESKESKTAAVHALLRLNGLQTEDGVLQFRLIEDKDKKPHLLNNGKCVDGQRSDTVVKDGVNGKDQGIEAKVSCRDAATSPLPRSTVNEATKTTRAVQNKATNTDGRGNVIIVNHNYPQLPWLHAPNGRRHEQAPPMHPQVRAAVGHHYGGPPAPPQPNILPTPMPPAQNPNTTYHPNGLPNTTAKPRPSMPAQGPPRMPNQRHRLPYQPNGLTRPPLFKIHGELSKPNVIINAEVKKLVCAFVNMYYHAKLNNTIRKISKNRIDGNDNSVDQKNSDSNVDQALLCELFENCKIAQDILKDAKFLTSETTEASPKETTDASTMTTMAAPTTITKDPTSPVRDTVYRPKYSFKCLTCVNRQRIGTKDASTTMRVETGVRKKRVRVLMPVPKKTSLQPKSDGEKQRANGETDVQKGTSVIVNRIDVSTDQAVDAVRKESVIMSAPCMQNKRSIEVNEESFPMKMPKQLTPEVFTPSGQPCVNYNQLLQPTAPLTWPSSVDNSDYIDVVTVDEPENASLKSVITQNLSMSAPHIFKQYPVINQIPNFGLYQPTTMFKPSAPQLRDDNFNFTVRQSLFLQAMNNFHAAFPLSFQPNSRTSLTNVVSTQKVPCRRATNKVVKPQEFPRRRCAKRKTGMHTTAVLC